MQVKFNTEGFEKALRDISRESDRSDYEIVTFNAETLLKSTVYNTPRDTGTTRAGLWPAWEALGKSGSPGTRRAYRPWKTKRGRQYVPDGRVEDRRRDRGLKSFLFINKTYVINNGKKVYYPYVLNRYENFMGRAEDEAAFKFGRQYERMMRKHGKL